MICAAPPPLRTGQADLPHPALQSVVYSVTETDHFRTLVIHQAKEPEFCKVAVWPALMIPPSATTTKAAPLSQDGAPEHYQRLYTAALHLL